MQILTLDQAYDFWYKLNHKKTYKSNKFEFLINNKITKNSNYSDFSEKITTLYFSKNFGEFVDNLKILFNYYIY